MLRGRRFRCSAFKRSEVFGESVLDVTAFAGGRGGIVARGALGNLPICEKLGDNKVKNLPVANIAETTDEERRDTNKNLQIP